MSGQTVLAVVSICAFIVLFLVGRPSRSSCNQGYPHEAKRGFPDVFGVGRRKLRA